MFLLFSLFTQIVINLLFLTLNFKFNILKVPLFIINLNNLLHMLHYKVLYEMSFIVNILETILILKPNIK